MNLDDFKSVRTYWITLYVNGSNKIGFDCFGVSCGKHRKFEKPKISYHIDKTSFFLLFAVSV